MKYWCLLMLCALLFPVMGQDKTVTTETDDLDTLKTHSVRKAAIFSAVIPGAGQVYNHLAMPKGKKKAFWKVPLIYAGLGATTYFAIQNNNLQRAYKQEHYNRTNYGISDPAYDNYDDQALIQRYRSSATNRDLMVLGVGIVYLLQVADAAVEAHFVRFDVSENVSMQLRPALKPLMGSPTGAVGLSLSFNFK